MRHIVTSSNLTSVDYDEGNLTLDVEFKGSGKTYRYFDVPKSTVDEMLAADSVGKYFNANIKPAYRCQPL